MTQYLTVFGTEQQFNDFKNTNDCPYVNVSYITETDEVKYFKDEIDTYQAQPFTLHIDRLSNGAQIELTFFVQRDPTQSGVVSYCRYKINNDPWKTHEFIINDEPLKVISGAYVQEGDTVQLICKTNQFNTLFAYRDTYDLQCTVSGNVMSLLYGDDYVFASAQTLPWPQIPYDGGGEKIEHIGFNNYIVPNTVDASNLWLPTRNLCPNIFEKMFFQHYDLTAAPDIKAKHLPKGACANMFQECTSLTTMPDILTETVERGSMWYMFAGCTNLVTTTEIHVNKIIPEDGNPYDGYDYTAESVNGMFRGCTSLVTAPVWAPDTLTIVPKAGKEPPAFTFAVMFADCPSLVDASPIKLNLNAWAYNRDQWMADMFGGDSSLTKAPVFGIYDSPNNDAEMRLDSNMFYDTHGSVNEMYTTYAGFCGTHNNSPLDVAATGTVYLPADSVYLPGGARENEMPFNLPAEWTKAALPSA